MTEARNFLDNPRFHIAALFIMGISIYVNQLWIGGLPGNDDGTYAAGALDMMDAKDPWTPRFNGDPQFSTAPPMFYGMLATSFRIFGPTDFAARFTGAAATVAAMLIIFILGHKLFKSPTAAGLAAVALALDPFVLKYGHRALAHTAWIAAATLAMGALYEARMAEKRQRSPLPFYLAFSLFSAASILFKSILGCFPLLIGGIWLLWEIIQEHPLPLVEKVGMRVVFRQFLTFAAFCLLAIGLGGIWFWIEYRRFGENFVNEHLGTMLFQYAFRYKVGNSELSPLFHFRVVLTRAISSSMILLPLTLPILWKQKSSETRLILAWILVPILCLAATARFEPRYLAPAFSGMALGLGFTLDRLWNLKTKQTVLTTVYLASLGWALATLAFPIPRGRDHLAETRPLIEAVKALVPPDQRWWLVVSPGAEIDPQWPNRMLVQHYELDGPVNRGVIQQILFYTRRRYRPIHAQDIGTSKGPGKNAIMLAQDKYFPRSNHPSLASLLEGPDWTLYRRN